MRNVDTCMRTQAFNLAMVEWYGRLVRTLNKYTGTVLWIQRYLGYVLSGFKTS